MVSVEINVRPRGTKYIASLIILFIFFSHIVLSLLVVVFGKLVPFCLQTFVYLSPILLFDGSRLSFC